MADYADLEITLRRKDGNRYAADLRFNAPGSDVDQRLLAGEGGEFTVDFPALKAARDNGEYGRLLGECFLGGAIGTAFAQARVSAASVNAMLRVRLLVEPTAGELQALRWETMVNPADGGVLSVNEQIALSRYLPSMDFRPQRMRPNSQLRALVVIADPADITSFGPEDKPLAHVDVAKELGLLEPALAGMRVTKLAVRGEARLDRMVEELRGGYDILYVICHGVVFGDADQGWDPRLFLEDKDGNAAAESGLEFVRLLTQLPDRPGLVVLASCQSAEAGVAEAIGPKLAENGIAAVVAMAGNITFETASVFVPRFFAHLREHGQIDHAMAVARQAVRERHDYWMPQLFLRLRSGRIGYNPGFGLQRGKDSLETWQSILGFVRRSNFVPIVGPNLSEQFLGRTVDLARALAEKYNYPMASWDGNDIAKVAQFVVSKHSPRVMRQELADLWLESARRLWKGEGDTLEALLGKALGEMDSPYRILAELQAKVYVNTNADPLLEIALRQAGREPVVIVCNWKDERRTAMESTEPTVEKPVLYYVFGKQDQRDTWVLTEDDFFDYLIRTAEHKLTPANVGEALLDNSIMFLGFPLDDWKFRVLFRLIYNKGGKALWEEFNHLGVQVNPDEATLANAARAKAYLESYFDRSKVDLFWGSATDFLLELERHMGVK